MYFIQQEFLDKMAATVVEQYSENPAMSDSYSRVVSDRHFQRLSDLLDGSPNRKVVCGGQPDREDRYIAPTILTGVDPDDKLMQEEIFGPILPVLAVRDHREAIDFINAR